MSDKEDFEQKPKKPEINPRVNYKGRFLYEIQTKDLGKQSLQITCSACQNTRYISTQGFIGRILDVDVGKYIYEVSPGHYQVENAEQFKMRKRK